MISKVGKRCVGWGCNGKLEPLDTNISDIRYRRIGCEIWDTINILNV